MEKVKTRRAQNWSHTIVWLCVCVCIRVLCVVAGFSYLRFSGVLLLIHLLYHWDSCMLRVVFGISANFNQMFFFLFCFLSPNGYFVTLWLVFMHSTKQAENRWTYETNLWMWVQQTEPSVNVLNRVNIYARFVFTYGTNLQRTHICMAWALNERWTAAIFITKCNAIDTRWFACLHLRWLLLKLLALLLLVLLF